MTNKSTLQKQYKNQVDRIRRALTNASKKGFVFRDDVTLKSLVKKPKKITSGTIRRLKKLTAKEIRKKYTEEFVDFKTGEVFSTSYGETYGKYHNQSTEDTISIDAADVIIQNFVNLIGSWVFYKRRMRVRDYSARDHALSWLSHMLYRYSKQYVAKGLQAAHEKGLWKSSIEVYKLGVERVLAAIQSCMPMTQQEFNYFNDQTDYDGDFYDMEEYTRDNVYYSDLYTF